MPESAETEPRWKFSSGKRKAKQKLKGKVSQDSREALAYSCLSSTLPCSSLYIARICLTLQQADSVYQTRGNTAEKMRFLPSQWDESARRDEQWGWHKEAAAVAQPGAGREGWHD